MAFKDSTVALMAKVGQMVTKTKTTWADLEGSSSDKSSDASKEALDPPHAAQFRLTVRVTGPKGTQSWVQALVTKGNA